MNHLLPASLVNQRNADESCTSSGNASAFPGDLTPSIQEVEYMITTVLNMYVPPPLPLPLAPPSPSPCLTWSHLVGTASWT